MQLPAGFAYGNGRLEADAIDVDTKFAGRIAKLLVDEGDRCTEAVELPPSGAIQTMRAAGDRLLLAGEDGSIFELSR